jgi:hypothetical protein
MIPPVRADTVALVSAGVPVGVPGGVVYNPIQYRGAQILAVDVTPPAWLNVTSDIVNKVATTREVASVRVGQAARQVINESEAASIVRPAGWVGVVPALPPRANLQAYLEQGQWGNAFIGLFQDVRTPIQITTASIDSIFAWNESVMANGDMRCRGSYVRAIISLLQLPSGISLFRNIVIAHHCMPALPQVEFVLVQKKRSRFQWYDYPRKCQINLEWDARNNAHKSDECVLLVRNSNLAQNAGHSGSQLDFVRIRIPPLVILAHELGHYLSELILYKKQLEIAYPGVVATAITTPEDEDYGPLAIIQQSSATIISQSTRIEIQKHWKTVLAGIVPDQPRNALTLAEKAFSKSWSSSQYEELLNIMPSSSILRNGSSGYSDGIVIGEAVLNGTIIIPPVGAAAVNTNGLVKENFIRFSHHDFDGFMEIFNTLPPADQTEFKDLAVRLLNKITINGNGATLNDLPWI